MASDSAGRPQFGGELPPQAVAAGPPQGPAFGLGPFGGPDPDIDTFGSAILSSDPRNRHVRRLYTLLVKLDPRKDGLEREHALFDLVGWIRRGRDFTEVPAMGRTHIAIERRFRMVLSALNLFASLRARLALTLHTLLFERSSLRLLAELGIPGDRGLMSETIDRLSHRLMPQPDDEKDITEFVAQLFGRPGDLDWLAALPVDTIGILVAELRTPDGSERALSNHSIRPPADAGPPSVLGDAPLVERARLSLPPGATHIQIWAPLRVALLEAILLLASRVSAAGLSAAIRARSPACALPESPFFRLPRAIDALLATAKTDTSQAQDMVARCFSLTTHCRDAARQVLLQLESQGVSVDVVYRLELIDRSLNRIDRLVGLLGPQPAIERIERARSLLVHLLEERKRELSLTDIVRTNLRLMARKVIERAGETGEHYITVTRGEYLKMLLSAGGGGILTAGTAALKFLVAGLQRAPLQEGLLNAVNYSTSFILMQFCGFTLATKQPSMTAAALAGALKKGDDLDGIVNTVARITRSQLAAAFGNVGMVIPATLIFDLVWQRVYGSHFLSAEKADYVLRSLHATESGTIPFAALTGAILWVSSLTAGWLENWAVYRRLPEAIAEHRIRRWVGSRITRWASRVFARNIAGVGGSSMLGFLLAMTPIIGQFVGIPLDVRHVTLSSGSLTLAMIARGAQPLFDQQFLYASLGILIIGSLNFGVSFVLALAVALRAREVTSRMVFGLAFSLCKGFFSSPFRFFLPVERASLQPNRH